MVTFQADIWNHTKGPSEWLDISARFLALQEKLDVDITRERPYNIETAEAIRELLEGAGMESTLAKFEGTLARLWYEARTLEQERTEARAREAAKATKEAQMAEIKAEFLKLKAQREKQASEDNKLVDEFVMVEENEVLADQFVVVNEKEVDEQWELVGQP